MPDIKNQNRNAKIANLQFFLSVLIVFIHANTTFMNLPGAELQYIFGLNFSSFIQVFISEGICRVAVPMFLCISGYLFFKSFDGKFKGYFEKLKKRFFSLVIPYLFWSAAVFFAFYFAQKIPALSGYFTTRNAGQLSLKIILEDIILNSYNSPLWFCRYLIVFTLLSIVFYWIIKKAWFLVLPIAFCGWFIGFPINVGFRMDAVFFYLLGAFIAIYNDLVIKLYKNISKFDSVFIIMFIILLFINTYLFCLQEPMGVINGNYDTLSLYVQKTTIAFGCLAIWFLYDRFVSINSPIWKYSQFSFFIFVCHHPIINVFKKLILKLMGINIFNSLLAYFLSAIITVCIVIMIAVLLNRVLPRIYKFISGNR